MPDDVIDLERERRNRGLSIAAAADEIGIPAATLHRAERRITRPRPAAALKIADFYGYKVTEVWPLEELEAA